MSEDKKQCVQRLYSGQNPQILDCRMENLGSQVDQHTVSLTPHGVGQMSPEEGPLLSQAFVIEAFQVSKTCPCLLSEYTQLNSVERQDTHNIFN